MHCQKNILSFIINNENWFIGLVSLMIFYMKQKKGYDSMWYFGCELTHSELCYLAMQF